MRIECLLTSVLSVVASYLDTQNGQDSSTASSSKKLFSAELLPAVISLVPYLQVYWTPHVAQLDSFCTV